MTTRVDALAYERPARRYLRLVDRGLPGRVVGFHLVGSAALGAFRPGHSDVDFFAVLDRPLSWAELRRLRLTHLLSAVATSLSALAHRRSPLSGTCNGVFVLADDLTKPLGQISPVASHTAERFTVGAGGDLNPVMWTVLRERGVCLRGPEPADLGLRLEPAALRAWNLANLDSYWRPWAAKILRSPGLSVWSRARWWTAWGVLGAPRLHCTITTGEIVPKEAAGEYALATFGSRWHPIVREGIAHRTGQPLDRSLGSARTRLRRAAEFVLHVADSARGS